MPGLHRPVRCTVIFALSINWAVGYRVSVAILATPYMTHGAHLRTSSLQSISREEGMFRVCRCLAQGPADPAVWTAKLAVGCCSMKTPPVSVKGQLDWVAVYAGLSGEPTVSQSHTAVPLTALAPEGRTKCKNGSLSFRDVLVRLQANCFLNKPWMSSLLSRGVGRTPSMRPRLSRGSFRLSLGQTSPETL